ncbi:MAG: SCO family protein [Planctomycetaceae bacterium]|nr:SCO family protein [Planctomycetaceae bacterium]MCA9066921.1 SCO family protein [Planctomycetaceae bacterium]
MKSPQNSRSGRRALLGLGTTAAAAYAANKLLVRPTASPATVENRSPTDGNSIVRTPGARYSDHLPDVTLTTQSGKSVRLVTDLIQDKRVLVSFFYIQCNGICPLTSALFQQLRQPLREEFGDDVCLISVTLDPHADTPDQLRRYASLRDATDESRTSGELAPWYFLTGSPEDVEQVRVGFGYTDPDPVIDADRTQHAGLFTFGNDRTNRWCTFPVGLPFDQTLAGVVRFLGTSTHHRYAWLPRPSPTA